MTRFIRRATIAAALIAAPLLTVAAPALAADPAPAKSAVTAKLSSGSTPGPYRTGNRWPRPRPTFTPSPSPTRTISPSAPAVTPAPTRTTAAPVTPSGFEAEVVTLTNAQRATAGCGALRTDDRLVLAARGHSTDMVTRKFFSHTGSDGSTFVTRSARAGYTTGASGENIAWGYRSPQEVVTGWMNSAGHRANILDCRSVAVGVGLALTADGTAYWTQNFGRV